MNVTSNIKVEEWATETYRRKKQQDKSIKQILEYLSFSNITPEQAIQQAWDGVQTRAGQRSILAFHKHLQSTIGKTAVTMPMDYIKSVRSFYRFYGLDFKFRRNELEEPEAVYIDHRFTLSEIAGMMYATSSKRNRAIIITGVSTGLSVGDIVKLPRKRIEDLLEKEPPVCIGPITRKKTRVKGWPFLHETAVEAIGEYLEERTDDNDFLFTTDEGTTVNPVYIDRMIKESFARAGFKVPEGERVRFHGLRKFFTSRCQDAGLETNVWKTLCCKKTSEAPYTTEKLRENFLKVQNRLDPNVITGDNTKVTSLQSELDTLRTILVAILGKERLETMVGEFRKPPVQGYGFEESLQERVNNLSNSLIPSPSARAEEMDNKRLLDLYARLLKRNGKA